MYQFEKAINLNPCLGKYHFRKGLCLDDLGRQQEALSSFAEAANRDVYEEAVHFELGKTQKISGCRLKRGRRYNEALTAFEKYS